MSESREIAEKFLEGWSIAALAVRFDRSIVGVENVLRWELDAARERMLVEGDGANDD